MIAGKLIATFLVCHTGVDPSTECVEGKLGPDSAPYVIEKRVKVVDQLYCLSPMAIVTAESDPRFGEGGTFTKIICKRITEDK
jgi:hypothetical protein